MATRKIDEAEQSQAIERLREMFPIGSTVSVVLRHVSQSGMTRAISVLANGEHGPEDVSYLVARATGDRFDQRHGGIKLGGGGMDMGLALVYGLACALYRDGFPCIGTGCPSNDHSNEWKAPNYTVGRIHSDPGYALSHRWV